MSFINKHNSAFSLIELLVVMAITAVLVALAAYGISILQRNRRDAVRTDIVTNIQMALEEYYLENGKYPDKESVAFRYIGTTTPNSIEICIRFSGANCVRKKTVQLQESFLYPKSVSTANTDAIGTLYCYMKVQSKNSYILGFRTEAGPWKTFKKSSTNITEECSASSFYDLVP